MSITSITSPAWRKYLTTACLSTTILIWLQDELYSINKVIGQSMSPALNNGDYILVKRADWRHWSDRRQLIQPAVSIKSITYPISKEDDKENDGDNKKMNNKLLDSYDLVRLQRDEELYGERYGLFSLYCRPPLILPGEVVIVKSPTSFFPNVEYHIKRVVSLGGQKVRPRSGNIQRRMEIIPDYSTWIEGDNNENSQDSYNYGAVSNKLIVGKAQYIIWPPSRIGPIQQIRPSESRASWLW